MLVPHEYTQFAQKTPAGLGIWIARIGRLNGRLFTMEHSHEAIGSWLGANHLTRELAANKVADECCLPNGVLPDQQH
eukprot:SAG11_NODE_1518_length_4761_cov_2.905405_3_plen_77_part_00